MFGRVWSLEAQEIMRKARESSISNIEAEALENLEELTHVPEHGFIGAE